MCYFPETTIFSWALLNLKHILIHSFVVGQIALFFFFFCISVFLIQINHLTSPIPDYMQIHRIKRLTSKATRIKMRGGSFRYNWNAKSNGDVGVGCNRTWKGPRITNSLAQISLTLLLWCHLEGFTVSQYVREKLWRDNWIQFGRLMCGWQWCRGRGSFEWLLVWLYCST